MKATKIYMLAAVALLTACNDDTVTYEPGAPDAPDCPGVYFDADNDHDFIFVPGEPANITIKMHRSNTAAAIDVPIIGSSTEQGVVFPSTIHFDAGSADTELVVDCSNLPIRKTAVINIGLPDQYINHYADTHFDYQTTALVSQWVDANTDGSPVKFWFTDTDYGSYPYVPKVTSVCYQPIESNMQVLPGAGLIRIYNFLNSGVDMTFSLSPSPFEDFSGTYRVSPMNNYISMVDVYESDAYGDEWYNAWFLLGYDEDGEEDYATLPLTDLDGNSSDMDYPFFFWYSTTYAFEYSYATLKNSGSKVNNASIGFAGTPSGNTTLPSYFYVYFNWDGESGL